MRHLAVLIAIASLTIGLGCKDKKNKAHGSSPKSESAVAPATASDKPKTTEVKPLAPQPELKGPLLTLVEAGAEPRRALRYAPKKKTEQRVNAVIEVEMESRLEGAPAPKSKMPTTEVSMTLTVKTSDKDGFSYELELTDARIDSPLMRKKKKKRFGSQGANMTKELDKVRGLKGLVTIDPRGFTKSSKFDFPKNVSSQVRSLVNGVRTQTEQLTPPMPEEAVGIGAKWTVEQRIGSQGVRIDQVSTFVIEKMTKDTIELAVTIEQKAGAQSMRDPRMPRNARLLGLTGTGSGRAEIRLDRPAPLKSATEIESTSDVSLVIGKTPKSLENVTTTSMSLSGS